jgi:ribose 5-phosphate isomerase B
MPDDVVAAGSRLWRMVVGADEAGREYKDAIRALLQADPRVSSVEDLGVFADETRPYPEIGIEAAQHIAAGKADRAVLVCGTGIGMAISANKVSGIRATSVADSFSVERSILSNNCQIITFGQRVIGLELAKRLASEWLGYTFDTASPSQNKVAIIDQFEQHQTPITG